MPALKEDGGLERPFAVDGGVELADAEEGLNELRGSGIGVGSVVFCNVGVEAALTSTGILDGPGTAVTPGAATGTASGICCLAPDVAASYAGGGGALAVPNMPFGAGRVYTRK